MEVFQALCHFLQSSQLLDHSEFALAVLFEVNAQTWTHSLHYKIRNSFFGNSLVAAQLLEVESQQLHNARMPELAPQNALFFEIGSVQFRIEGTVQFLDSTWTSAPPRF